MDSTEQPPPKLFLLSNWPDILLGRPQAGPRPFQVSIPKKLAEVYLISLLTDDFSALPLIL
jgi:hypothetical protein